MVELKVGACFKVKTGWKSKFQGRTFVVKKITDNGALLCHVMGASSLFFYITKKRNQAWIDRHIEVCGYKPKQMVNK